MPQQQQQQQFQQQRNGSLSGPSPSLGPLGPSNGLPNNMMNSFGPSQLSSGLPMMIPDYSFVFSSKMDRNGVILGVDCEPNKVSMSRISWLVGRRLSECCYRNDDVEVVNRHLNESVQSKWAVSQLYRICSTTPPPLSNDSEMLLMDGVKSEQQSNGMLSSSSSKSNSFDANNSGNNSSAFDGDTTSNNKERNSSGETLPIHFLIRSQSSQHTGLEMSPPDSSALTSSSSNAALPSLASSSASSSTTTKNNSGGGSASTKSSGRRSDQGIPKHCETISSTHYVIL